MNKIQFIRWEKFSIKMAENGFLNITKVRREKLVSEVKEYFETLRYENAWPEIKDWDGNDDEYDLCDQVRYYFEEHLHYNRREGINTGRFHNQITCCIRAGFDVAVKPSGGVIGFTVGDVCRMWDNKVPKWVKNYFDGDFNTFQEKDPVWL